MTDFWKKRQGRAASSETKQGDADDHEGEMIELGNGE